MSELRFVEFFAGIGGFSASVSTQSPSDQSKHAVVAAIDIDQNAARVFRANFSARYICKSIESLKVSWIESLESNAWWLSPPCQPFTRRGAGRDDHDPRSLGLLHLIDLLPQLRPRVIALENVPGFHGSRTEKRLREQLFQLGYHQQSRLLCPSEMGWPNRRQRYYLIASLDHPVADWKPLPKHEQLWTSLVDPSCAMDRRLVVTTDIITKHWESLDRLTADRAGEPTACFASSYGVAIAKSGSYLQTPEGWRRFSPREILNLLGFPESFRMDSILPELSLRQQWKLVGNSLSIPAIRYLLQHI